MSGMSTLKHTKGFHDKNLKIINSWIVIHKIKMANYCLCDRNSLSRSIIDTSRCFPPPVNDNHQFKGVNVSPECQK